MKYKVTLYASVTDEIEAESKEEAISQMQKEYWEASLVDFEDKTEAVEVEENAS